MTIEEKLSETLDLLNIPIYDKQGNNLRPEQIKRILAVLQS